MEQQKSQGSREQYTNRSLAVRRELPFIALVDVGMRTDAPNDGWFGHRGLCLKTDPELFFPKKGGSARAPKEVCKGCPVIYECGEDALAQPFDHDSGVRGGMSEAERRAERSRRSRLRQKATEQQSIEK